MLDLCILTSSHCWAGGVGPLQVCAACAFSNCVLQRGFCSKRLVVQKSSGVRRCLEKKMLVSNLSGVKGFCLWCTSVSGAKDLRCKELLVQKSSVVKAFDIKLFGSKAAWRKVFQL